MRSLLDALQEGRLVELPEVGKDKALEYLAILIEAVPDIGTRTDLVKAVMEREARFNTGIGNGVAVPHCRTDADGELLCAVGWSPSGIEYGSPDGKPVHLVVMYYVPDVQRNLYLKEISGLAKVLGASDVLKEISHIENLTDLRDRLLDWVSQAIGEAVPDAKARMIKLDARRASFESSPAKPVPSPAGRFIPFQYACFGNHVLVLSADSGLVDTLEHSDEFLSKCGTGVDFSTAGYAVALLSETAYSHGRKVFSAVAWRAGG